MLTVVKYSHSSSIGGSIWDCICDCGEPVQALGYLVKEGRLLSCGCLRKEIRKAQAEKYQAFGESKTLAEWELDPRCKVAEPPLRSRLRSGWDVETAITTPSRRKVGGKPKGYKKPRVPLKELLLDIKIKA
jgi:hypothetical protein